MIGSTLDKYEVLQKIGEGGMATVYRGRHATLNRDVAIKVLHPHLSSSQRNRKRFAREARAIEHLHHENILEIFDYSGMEADECYIITEFVQGETLTALLQRRGALPSEVAALIGRSLAHALAYAHREGILHRDLKTDNVMVRADGTVKLMDFGIARFLDESQVTMTGALVGSPAFMSPEQAREQDLDHRSDLFALGTVLYYLVSGHLPFAGSNASLILKNVIEGNRPGVAELAPGMSARLADVVERLMATSPDDRFNDASEVAAALDECLAEAEIPPDDPDFGLRAYLADAEAWERRLDAHLEVALVRRGRALLQAGDHLAALRLFNRLLSIDEDNEEVLTLVQGLHGEPAPSSRRGVTAASILALVLLFGGMGALYALARTVETDPPPVARVAPSPAPPPPAPAPAVAVRPPPPDPEPAAPEPEVASVPSPKPGPRPAPVPRPPSKAPVPAPAPVVVPDAPGRLVVNSGELAADVWIDGRQVGDTRQSIQVTPGIHRVELRGLFVEAHVEQVAVSPGEEVVLNVRLNPRPAHVRFDVGDDDACQVVVDDVVRGTLVSLQRRVRLEDPMHPHTVELRCPDAAPRVKRFDFVAGEESFPR